jgi:hypothetical protein
MHSSWPSFSYWPVHPEDDLSHVLEVLGRPLRWFARTNGGVCGGTCHSSPALRRVVANLSAWNLYATLNPTRLGGGPKAATSDVLSWRWVLIDLDPLGCPTYEPDWLVLFGAIAQALDLETGSVPQNASTILYSGRGWQVWLPVADTQVVDRQHALRIECSISNFLRIVSGIAHLRTHVIDQSCRDLARVARMPGTRNLKTGRPAMFHQLGDGRRISPHDILELPSLFPDIQPLEPTHHRDLTRVLPHLSDRAVRYLTEGVFSPGRHSAAYAAAAALRDVGIPLDLATPWVQGGGRRCLPPLPSQDATRCTRNAYHANP